MLTGYSDENVKAAIVAGLRRNGMNVVTAQERGQRETDDEILPETAAIEGRLLMTNDTDFLRIHSDWLAVGRSHAGIVYWPQRMTIGEAIRRLLAYSLGSSPAEVAGTVRHL